MTVPVQVPDLPATEAEVVRRLKIKPRRIKITASHTPSEGDYVRHWVVLEYDVTSSLRQFGKVLYDIACDVEQAGGWVTQIQLGTELRPAN